MSVSLGPVILVIYIIVFMVIGHDFGIDPIISGTVGFLSGMAVWYYLAKITGRPSLTYGFGVDHFGPPNLTFKAMADDFRNREIRESPVEEVEDQ